MDNPEAIRFSDDVVRVLCEQARALKIKLDAMKASWYGGIATHFTADTNAAVEDGREDEGISRLTCGDVVNAVAQLLKTATGEAQEWNGEVIQKPCVRTLP